MARWKCLLTAALTVFAMPAMADPLPPATPLKPPPVVALSPETAAIEADVRAASPPKISGAFVYVYSFLDIRQDQFGRDCIALIDNHLIDALKQSGADAKVLNFKESAIGMDTAELSSPGTSSTQIPVRGTILSNAADEHAVGARYRLIVFPTSFRPIGAGQSWEIRWSLIDTTNDRTIWTSLTHGHRVIWASTNEGADTRARNIVKAFMAELRTSGIG